MTSFAKEMRQKYWGSDYQFYLQHKEMYESYKKSLENLLMDFLPEFETYRITAELRVVGMFERLMDRYDRMVEKYGSAFTKLEPRPE